MKLTTHPKNKQVYVTLKTARGNVTMSTGTSDKKDAMTIAKAAGLDKIEIAAQAGRLQSEMLTRINAGRRITVKHAVKEFAESMKENSYKTSTIRITLHCINRWITTMKLLDRPVYAIDEKVIGAYINAPKSTIKLSTRRRILAAISTFVSFCNHRGYISDNPSANLRIKYDIMSQAQKMDDETIPLNLEDVNRLLRGTEAGSFWNYAVQLGWTTGMRLGDICCLEWASIGDRSISVVTSKRGVPVEHAITPELRRLFKQIRDSETTSARYCFPAAAAQYLKPSGQAVMSKQFARLCERLGIEGKSFHGLRHAYALRIKAGEMEAARQDILKTILSELGDIAAQKQLGHGSIASTRIYTKH